jgi:glycine/D-amino acid oxidase-like deaminating enzyme
MAMAEVTVRGAGVFGLAVGFACARRGARVRVIDPRGVAAGASGGPVGALAPHVPENWNPKKAFQLDSLLMAPDFWGAADALSGRSSGYGRSGRVQPLADARAVALAQERAEGAARLWRGQARWRVVTEAQGWKIDSPTGRFVHDTLTARLAPAAACASLAGAITALGGEIAREGADAGAVFWATGYEGLRALSEGRPRSAGTGVKGQALLLAHSAPELPQLFVEGLHIVPHADGTLAIGSTSEREFDDPAGTDAQAEALLDRAVAAVPSLAGARELRRWAGVRPRARSRAPMLGEWPGRPGHYIANGGFKIGFGVAPRVAQVMAELMLEGKDGIPEGFRVEDNL